MCEGFKNALDAKPEIWKGLNGWMLQSGAFVLGISKLGRCDMRHHARLSLRSRTLDAGAPTDVFFSLRRRRGPYRVYRPCLNHNRRNPIKGTYIVTKARCGWGKRVYVYVWTPAIVLSQFPCFLPSAVFLSVVPCFHRPDVGRVGRVGTKGIPLILGTHRRMAPTYNHMTETLDDLISPLQRSCSHPSGHHHDHPSF